MYDELLRLEIERLRQMLILAAMDMCDIDGTDPIDYLHDLSTRDYFQEQRTRYYD